jgi:hypothetical protein
MPVDEPGPVTADDVEEAADLAVRTFATCLDADWHVLAGTLDDDCWDTFEHVTTSLLYYAAQVVPLRLPATGPTPFLWRPVGPGRPEQGVATDPGSGVAGLLRVFGAVAGMLAAVVRTTPSSARAHHVWGRSDPEGFAAMGVVEILVHGHDVASGLDVAWEPPARLCARARHRLFPAAPTDTPPWPTLLWATGRAPLTGHDAVGPDWTWVSSPRSD